MSSLDLNTARKSSFKFITGKPWGPSCEHRDLPLSPASTAPTAIRTNGQYFAFTHRAQGLLAFRHVEREFGKFPDANQRDLYTIKAHTQRLVDFDLEPFVARNSARILTAAATEIKLWSLMDDEPGTNGAVCQVRQKLLSQLSTTSAVTRATFHPLVSGLVVSAHRDQTVTLWNMDQQQAQRTITNCGSVQSLSFSHASGGDLMLTAAKSSPSTVALWDLRASRPLVGRIVTHGSAKPSQAIYMDVPYCTIFSVGFSRQGEREIRLWDQRMLSSDTSAVQPRAVSIIDSAAGAMQVHYDMDAGLVFLAGKGDSHISWFEIDDQGIHMLNKYDSDDPQVQLAWYPKLSVDVDKLELQRVLKLHSDNRVSIVSLTVPRKDNLVEYFQEDIFPPTWDGKPTCSADSFLADIGSEDRRTFLPKLQSLKPKNMVSIYDISKELGGKERPQLSQQFFKKLATRGAKGDAVALSDDQDSQWTWKSLSWSFLYYVGMATWLALRGMWKSVKFIGFTAPMWAWTTYRNNLPPEMETVTIDIVDKETGKRVSKQVQRAVVRQRITDEASAREYGSRMMQQVGPLPIDPKWLKRQPPAERKYEEVDLIDVKNGKQPLMYLVKGRRNLRVTQVRAHVDSLASNDCFVVDLGKTIFIWIGQKSNRIERAASLDFATRIKSKERGNAGIRIVQLEEGKIPSNILEKRLFEQDFRRAIHAPATFDNRANREEATDVYDEEWHIHVDQRMRLFKIDNNVVSKLELISNDPDALAELQTQLLLEIDLMGKRPSHSILDSHCCYIVDASDSEVCVWTGKAADPAARRWAVAVGRLIANQRVIKNTVQWAGMTRAFEAGEPAVFKDKFSDFPGQGVMIATKQVEQGAFVAPKREQQKIDLAELLQARRRLNNVPSSNQSGRIDPVEEEFKCWRVSHFELEEYCHVGHFFSADAYIIDYSYEKIRGGKRHHKIFYWQGRDSHRREKGTQAFKTVEVAEELSTLENDGGYAVQVRVRQSKEQTGFLPIFARKGYYIVHKGSYRANWHMTTSVAMYDVRGSSSVTAHAVQVDKVARKHLNSLHAAVVFVGGSEARCFCWIGRFCPPHERDASISAARRLLQLCGKNDGHSITVVEEGQEDAVQFWSLFPKCDTSTPSSIDSLSHNRDTAALEQATLFVVEDYTGAIEIHDVCATQHLGMRTPRSGRQVGTPIVRSSSSVEDVEAGPASFSESDLDSRKVYLLDDPTRRMLFVWMGAFSKPNTKKFVLRACREYAKMLQIDQDDCIVEWEGQESDAFTSCFHAWSTETVTSQARAKAITESGRKSEPMAVSTVEELYDKMVNTTYTYEQLVHGAAHSTLPDGVDRTKLETYLADQEFETVFKMTREAFERLPSWRALQLKKKLKLY